MEGMIGEIRMFAGNFAPKNWAFCQGQIIQIASNTALFSILGTTYGGNGTTTYALPNLASRVAIGAGTMSGGSTYFLGQAAGEPSVTLITTQMPAHTHTATGNYAPPAINGQGDETNPGSAYLASATGGPFGDIYNSASNGVMGPSPITATVSPVGGNQPHDNQQPYLGMNYVICMYGIFPSRN
jgi:microcystin-dependent protein